MSLKNRFNKVASTIKKVMLTSSPRWLVLLIDLVLVANSFLVAYLIRYNFSFNFNNYHFFPQLILVLSLALIAFLITGSYKGIVKHTSFKDVIAVTVGVAIYSAVLMLLVYVSRKFKILPEFNMPISVVGINFFTSIFLLIFSRIVYKGFYYQIENSLKKPKRVIIHGAKTGFSVYDALQSDVNNNYDVVAFVDSRDIYTSKMLNRISIIHPNKITDSYIIDKNIKEVILSEPEASPMELLEIANKYSELGIVVKSVPHINQWINNEVNISQIKELNIEDLLNRVPIKIDNPKLALEVTDNVVMVTGAAGSIGSEISKQILALHPSNLILIDQAESALYDLQQDFIRNKFAGKFTPIIADVRNVEKMDEYFELYKPDIIFHAAAYKHVPLMESNPYEAIKVNVLGSKNIMDLAIKHKVKRFVMISTDKAVNPTNVMGATKRAAEIYATYIQKSTNDTKFIITRFGNVLGSNGSVIQLFKKQIKKGGPLTVTHKEITRYFMTIPEACNLVLEAGIMGKGGEIFVFDMGKPVLIYDLAVKMIHLSGYKFPDDIDIIITGLRPGEKLYEETLGKNEGDLPTHHEKVMIAKINEVSDDNVNKIFTSFESINSMGNLDLVRQLKELIPEYISNNSEFDKLDK